MPHSPTHRSESPSRTPAPSSAPRDEEEPSGSITTATGQVIEIGGRSGPDYWDEVEAFLEDYVDERGPKIPKGGLYGRGYPSASRRDKIANLQMRLVEAGLLDPSDVKNLGSLDNATLNALRQLQVTKRFYGFDSEDDALNELREGFIGWDAKKAREADFTPSPFQPLADQDVSQRVTDVARSLLGMDPTPDQLKSATDVFRQGERRAYDQAVGYERQVFEAAGDEQSGTVPAPTIQRPADPGEVARSQLENTPQAEGFKVALLVSRLIGSLRGSL